MSRQVTGVRSPEECPAEIRQQERPHRCAQAGRSAPRRACSRRSTMEKTGCASSEGVGAQLSDDQQGSHASHESAQGALTVAGAFLAAARKSMHRATGANGWQDNRSRRAPSRRVLPTKQLDALQALRQAGAAGPAGREPETRRDEIAAPDSSIGPIRAALLLIAPVRRRIGSAPSDNSGPTAAWR